MPPLDAPSSRGPSGSRAGPLGEATNAQLAGRTASRTTSSAKRVGSSGYHDENSMDMGDSNDGDDDPDASRSSTGGKRHPSHRPRHSLNNRLLQQRSVSRADQPPSSDASGHSSHSSSGANRTASSSSATNNRSGMSTLARANANARRVSMVRPGALAAPGALESVKKLNVDSTSFDEWMKMATDNKINPTNTFSIALIDYFHDMSLLRSDSGDGSINFQKASCTLDGCVKVWTSRVDSVVTETGKLLNGLVGDGHAVDDDEDIEGQLELDEDGNPIGVKSKKDKRKRARAKEATLVKNFSAIAVKKLDLEYTVDPLFKKTSADFDEGGAGGLLMNHLGVDSKMRIVFDAGEAPGLPEDNGSSGADQGAGDDGDDGESGTPGPREPPDTIDLSRLQTKLFSLAPASVLSESLDPLSELLQGRLVCPSLSHFSFGADQQTSLFGQENDDSDDEDGGHNAFDFGEMNPAIAATPWGGDDDPENAFAFDANAGMQDDDDDDDDSGADLFGVPAAVDRDAEVFGLPPESTPGFPQQQQAGGAGDAGDFDFFDGGVGDSPQLGADEDGGAPVQWDPRQGPSQHDLLLAFKGVSGNDDEGADGGEGGARAAGGGLFDYFDQKLMKSWAGPEHWKMRSRLAGFANLQAGQRAEGSENDPAAVAAKPKRAPKEAFVIDFTSEEGEVSAKELFEAPRSASTTLLPKARSKPEAYLLPEDRHFTSRMLLRLFSKPRAVLNIRTRKGGVRFGGPNVPGFGGSGDAEIDADYWAQQQAAREAQGGGGGGGDGGAFGGDVGFDDDGGFGMDGGDAPMPLDTQFYHDGDDEGAFELASAMPSHQANPNSAADVDVADFEEEDLAAQAAAMKRVKPEYVNYAKKAKRVDVRKLKENIWKELAIEGPHGAGGDGEGEGDADTAGAGPSTPKASPPEGQQQLDASGAKTFRSVLSGLRKAYPKEKMEEISTSFCFICLLHLANEEGLEIQLGEGAGAAAAAGRGVGKPFLTPGRIVEEDEDDEDVDEDDEEEEDGGRLLKRERRGSGSDDDDDDDDDADWKALKVGRLEYLRIKKDPKAGRSA